MKYFSMLAILAAAICVLNGCASTDTASTGAKVPGEVKSDEESRLQPGAGAGPNASVKW
jgi:type IV pilus biogenesis protein CpaD/CtpE